MPAPRGNNHEAARLAAREAAGRRLWSYLLALPEPIELERATAQQSAVTEHTEAA
jgi:hypothetical protein